MNRLIYGRIWIFHFLSMFMPLTTSAQTNTTELHGLLWDPSGNRVPGAAITIQTLDTGLVRTFTTGDDGSYAFLGLRPGQYSVRISAAGFRPVVAYGVPARPATE